ncbi:hypothetical protein [Janthinobacterium aquaticum]|uniref:hypothetical protein n=1 Tax=Janthinobacterium sp. FT58W TaxID=2654254 RepID=UPI0012648DFA|nr:hypothetical protein [Janthinobacterium sp. FT58W]KAB8042552.1 hypothetical protein GCM43_13590 [Janthinobacterium sp. FT58W]
MTFNIKQLAIAAAAEMIVRDAAGEPQADEQGNALTITLHSPGTKEFQKARHAAEERNSARVFNRMQGKADAKQSADDKIKERAEFLAACTISFNNFGDGQGAGYELFKRTYSDIEIGHIADDVEKFLGERSNFKKKLLTSSPTTSGTLPG